MFRSTPIARIVSIAVAITIIISMLPAQAASGQSSGVQSPYIGMWLSASELANLPTSGAAWNALVSAAGQSGGSPDIQNQDSDNDVYVLAKALVFARTGDTRYRNEVLSALRSAINTENGGRTLALGRNLVSYVIAADLINLPAADRAFDSTFRTWLRDVIRENLDGRTLVATHEDRPNNWGTHAGASRAAVAWYLGDRAELDRTAQVFRGWLGDRSAYAGFSYGEPSWQCTANQPVGVNPRGCTKNGVNIDGAQPEEMRRGGTFKNPPTFTGYPWEALQGSLVQGIILHRAGYGALQWSDRGLLRAVDYLYRIGWPAEGDDRWQPWLVNYYYGTNYPTSTAGKGKNMGWTDWTHGARSSAPAPTAAPVQPTNPPAQPTPTLAPTQAPPTAPTAAPTTAPTAAPTAAPTQAPVLQLPGGGANTIKAITFEEGKVISESSGVDRTKGTVDVTTSGPLAGRYSVNLNSSDAYLQEDFNGTDEVFVSFLLRLNALPGSDARILLISNDGDTVGNLVLRKNGALRLRMNSTAVGSDSPALAAGTTYRVGLYQKRGSGGNAVLMAFVAPVGQSFGAAFASQTNGGWRTAATFVRFGATNGSQVNVKFDDVIVSSAFVP